jgi:hypothetical protein
MNAAVMLMTAAMVAACGTAAPPLAAASTPSVALPPSATPDPCAPQYMRSTVGEVNRVMQKFDDESSLASSVPRSQLATHIAALQSIRREALNQTTPPCVAQLRELELTHMNTVIDTMLAFLGRGDQVAVTKGISVGRQQHDQYVLELARLLGVTAVAVTPAPSGTMSAASEVAPTPGGQNPPGASSGFVALNAGPVPVTLRAVPATAGDMVATLPIGQSAVALGGSSDGQWIQVIVPDHPYQTAWVLASLVQVVLPTPQ